MKNLSIKTIFALSIIFITPIFCMQKPAASAADSSLRMASREEFEFFKSNLQKYIDNLPEEERDSGTFDSQKTFLSLSYEDFESELRDNENMRYQVLFMAAYHAEILGAESIVIATLYHGADINEMEQWRTALHVATTTSMVQLLLDHGAQIDMEDGMIGETPLITHAKFGHTEIVKTLLLNGAQVNAADSNKATALMHTLLNAYNDRDSLEKIVEALIHAHADIQAKDRWGKSVETYAINDETQAVFKKYSNLN